MINILLLEDDEEDKIFFKEAIQSLNIPHEVICAGDSSQFFNLLQNKDDVDIIFLDLSLPFDKGIDCLKKIKGHEIYKNIPVVIFTGSNITSDIEETYQDGAHYHIVKPYSHMNYVASLKTVLDINWKEKQPRPPRDKYVVNLTFN